jgi:hypothetical protein
LAERGYAPRHVRRGRNSPCCSRQANALAGRKPCPFDYSSGRDRRWVLDAGAARDGVLPIAGRDAVTNPPRSVVGGGS